MDILASIGDNHKIRTKKISEISKKITKGLKMAFDNLVKKTADEDGELYFSENGKVVAVKAKKLLKKNK